MIKWILNRVPRGVLQRMAGWMMPVAGLFYKIGRGRNVDGESGYAKTRGVECPLCGARYRRFMPYGYVEVRKNALCPRCLSLERHRLLWLWLISSGKLKMENGKLANATNDGFSQQKFLHIAPEVCLMRKFEKIFDSADGVSRVGQKRDRSEYDTHTFPCNVSRSYGTRSNDLNDTTIKPTSGYITADLESPLAKVKMDVQNIPFADGTFDVVFCNHVLEHVADDRLAMREMYRVMKPEGWGVMLSPVDETRAETFEDDTIVDPAERTRIFGQYDHRRVYGRDYADRLRETGWMVEEIDYFTSLTPEERRSYGLRKEILYIVKKAL